MYILLAVILVSCQKSLTDENGLEYEAIKAELNVSETSLELSCDEQSKSIQIVSNSYWSISSSASWIYLNTTEGKGNASLPIRVSANYSTIQKRSATLVVTDGINNITVQILQEQAADNISLSKTALSFTYSGGSETVYVDANSSWNAQSDASWCTISMSSSRISVSVKSNESYSARSATISVKSSSESTVQNITVNQSGAKEPSLDALTLSEITPSSTQGTFSYSSPDFNINRYGICYSNTQRDPSLNDIVKSEKRSNKSGSVSLTLTDLSSNTTYYARPFVETVAGTTYGKSVSFTTAKSNSPVEGDNPPPSY